MNLKRVDTLSVWELLKNDSHLQIFVSFASFVVLFYVCWFLFTLVDRAYKLNADRAAKIGTVSRLVSSIHALIVTTLTLYIMITESKFESIENKVSYMPYEVIVDFNIVTGYLLFDLAAMLVYKEIFEGAFIVHHLVSITGFYACINQHLLAFYALYRLMSEASTLFVNIRWILLTFKMKNSKYYMYNGVAGLLVFTLSRIVTIFPFWYMMYNLVNSPFWSDIAFYYKFICVGGSIPLDTLNVYWFYRILVIAFKSSKPAPESKIAKD